MDDTRTDTGHEDRTEKPIAGHPDRTNANMGSVSERGPAQDLYDLVLELETFVMMQIDRFDLAFAESLAEIEKREEIDRMRTELQCRERELDQRRRNETGRIEEEYAQLTQAWDHLETEQRRLLTHGDSATESEPDSQSVEPVSAARQTTAANRTTVDLVREAETPSLAAIENHRGWSRELATQQFQQLKREIRRHSRRRES